jgi:hypothetical protein
VTDHSSRDFKHAKQSPTRLHICPEQGDQIGRMFALGDIGDTFWVIFSQTHPVTLIYSHQRPLMA